MAELTVDAVVTVADLEKRDVNFEVIKIEKNQRWISRQD